MDGSGSICDVHGVRAHEVLRGKDWAACNAASGSVRSGAASTGGSGGGSAIIGASRHTGVLVRCRSFSRASSESVSPTNTFDTRYGCLYARSAVLPQSMDMPAINGSGVGPGAGVVTTGVPADGAGDGSTADSRSAGSLAASDCGGAPADGVRFAGGPAGSTSLRGGQACRNDLAGCSVGVSATDVLGAGSAGDGFSAGFAGGGMAEASSGNSVRSFQSPRPSIQPWSVGLNSPDLSFSRTSSIQKEPSSLPARAT